MAGKRKLVLTWYGYVRLSDESERAKIPLKPGVYKIATKGADGMMSPFYVGQSEKLRERVDQHATHSDNKCVRGKVNQFTCYVAWAAVEGEEDRDGAERALYFRFNPECNDPNGVPNGPDLDVNTDMA